MVYQGEGLALMEEAFPRRVTERLYKFFAAALAEARLNAALIGHARARGSRAQYLRRPGEWTIRPRTPPAPGACS